MSFALDIYYAAPEDAAREAKITAEAHAAGGRFDFRDLPSAHSNAICLTFEFTGLSSAESAASILRARGEHVEGPYDYAD